MSEAAPRSAWCDVCGAPLPKDGGACPVCGNTAELSEILPRDLLTEKPAATAAEGSKGPAFRPKLLHIVLVLVALAAVAIGAAALGVYSGLREREQQELAEAATHYQRGLDSLAAADYALAVAEFEYVERLRPGYLDAGALLAQAREKMAAQPTPTSRAREDISAGLLAQAQDEMEREAWNEAIKTLQDLQHSDPTYQTEQVQTFLFQCMYNAGQQAVQNGDVAAALEWFKQAQAINPQSTDVLEQIAYAAAYLDAMEHWGSSWTEVIVQLQALNTAAPGYCDVSTRLATAYSRFGDELSSETEWCQAMVQYGRSLELQDSQTVRTKMDLAQSYCLAPEKTATVEELGTGTPEALATATASPLPGNASLFFAMRDAQGSTGIYVLTADSGDTPRLLIANADQPAVRADGSIAFRNLDADQLGISMAAADGTLSARISRYAEDAEPTWEAGNARVAFASTRESDRKWRIYVNDNFASASGATAVAYGYSPAWGPNGLIAYRGCDESGNKCGLYVMRPDGAQVAQLTNDPNDDMPAWSTDGTHLAFTSSRSGRWAIWVLDVEEGTLEMLTDGSGTDAAPVWSPDGRSIAFLSNRGGEWGIWVVSASGGQPSLLASIGALPSDWSDYRMAWH